MALMNSADIDLNLLRVLDALLDTGSVVGAAAQLHLSPPAVSRSLGRLRKVLDDPLFVRAGRELVPTRKESSSANPGGIGRSTQGASTLDVVGSNQPQAAFLDSCR
jgi:hypothetical protein